MKNRAIARFLFVPDVRSGNAEVRGEHFQLLRLRAAALEGIPEIAERLFRHVRMPHLVRLADQFVGGNRRLR